MRSEDLFLAIGNVEDARLARSERSVSSGNVKEDKNMKVRPARLFRNLLVAALAICMLAVTASASEVVRSWFATYFSGESEAPLSQAQVEVIEKNVQDINQSQTCNGFTMEVQSVLTDGYNLFISVGITAPEDVYLDRTVKEGYDPAAPVIWLGENSSWEVNGKGYGMTWNMSDDGDGRSNTHNIVYLMSADKEQFSDGGTIKIHIEDLYAEYTNDAYAKELEEKYGFEPKLGLITDEEAEKLWTVEQLAEGTWDFEIALEKINTPVVELLDQPMDYVMISGGENYDDEIEVETKITSIRISPLGVVCRYEEVKNPLNGVWGDIVMKDGSTHNLSGNTIGGFGNTSCNDMFSVPIALSEIDHILLNGETVILMPELETE